MTEWFARWFGEDYLRLYPHRDARDAELVIDLIAQHINFEDAHVLDLACGPGRHVSPLQARGAVVTGLDLSRVLLDRARAEGTGSWNRVRADMRSLPFGPASFDVVVNLFTSFGYFDSDQEHESVLGLVHASLRDGGKFAIDFLNPAFVRKHLVPTESTTAGGHQVDVVREITGGDRYVQKTMRVVDDGTTFVERVRLYDAEDLKEMLARTGLEVEHEFGSYAGDPITEDAPRTVLISTKR